MSNPYSRQLIALWACALAGLAFYAALALIGHALRFIE